MKQFFIILIILFCFSSATYAQERDSLVYPDEITYSSDFERKVFDDYFNNNSVDYLALFLTIDKNLTEDKFIQYKNEFQNKIAALNNKRLQKKSGKKKIKFLYSNVHDTFLKKYELQNHFSSIFSKGYYNCVSGSALYGLIFNYLDIPYVIREKPTHVYLMAYPNSERVLVEPTDPQSGYLTFSDTYKSTFITNLTNSKIIGENEAKTYTVNQLFDKYYFAEENISLKELIGIQYTNDALYKLQNEEIEDAYYQLEKAYLFYPSEKTAYLLFATTAQILNTCKYDDLKYAKLLAKLERYKNIGIKNEDIIAEFVRVNELLLIEKNLTEEYETFYTEFVNSLSDNVLKNEISYIFNYENGRVLFNQGKYEKALPFLQKAYVLKVENHDINNLLVSSVAQALRFESDNKKVVKTLEKLKSEFPDLMKNNVFKSMIVNAYLIGVFHSYDLNNSSDGNRYKNLFTEYYTKDLNIDENLLGRAYGTAAVYYFKQGYKTKAINILNEGLKISPRNHELIIRKKMIH